MQADSRKAKVGEQKYKISEKRSFLERTEWDLETIAWAEKSKKQISFPTISVLA